MQSCGCLVSPTIRISGISLKKEFVHIAQVVQDNFIRKNIA